MAQRLIHIKMIKSLERDNWKMLRCTIHWIFSFPQISSRISPQYPSESNILQKALIIYETLSKKMPLAYTKRVIFFK